MLEDSEREESRITEVNLISNLEVSTKSTLHHSQGFKFLSGSKSVIRLVTMNAMVKTKNACKGLKTT